jgi:hypothetical protein
VTFVSTEGLLLVEEFSLDNLLKHNINIFSVLRLHVPLSNGQELQLGTTDPNVMLLSTCELRKNFHREGCSWGVTTLLLVLQNFKLGDIITVRSDNNWKHLLKTAPKTLKNALFFIVEPRLVSAV